MPKGFRSVVLMLIMFTVVTTACTTSDNPRSRPVNRTTENIKIIQAGDFIEYTVYGTFRDTQVGTNLIGAGFCEPELVVVEKNLVGTLRVSWPTTTSLPRPLQAPGTIAVLEQVVTLDLENADNPFDTFSGLVSFPVTHTSYISQDAEGSVTLHAMPDVSNPGEYFWVSTAGIDVIETDIFGNDLETQVADLTSVINPVILPSPVSLTGGTVSQFDYHFNEGCDGMVNCSESSRYFSGSHTFSGEVSDGLVTALGEFKPIVYLHNGYIKDREATRNVSLLTDIRAFCDTQGTGLNDNDVGYSGVTWILPEFGVLKSSNVCSSNVTTTVDMSTFAPGTCTLPTPSTIDTALPKVWDLDSIELSSTNIALPG